jgi:sugar lactone lactonase YvrE
LRLRGGSLIADGALATGVNNPDSMCLDAYGTRYVGTKVGLQVIRADGERLRVIPVRSACWTAHCSFGGPAGTTLLITAWKSVYTLEGLPVPGLDYVRHQGIPYANAP